MFRVILPLCITVMFGIPMQAQEGSAYDNPEEGFALMRRYADSSNYDSAIQVGYQLLKEQENYHDVALLLARVHGWESSFDSAYMVLDTVISRSPDLFEAYQTCVDLAYWENNWGRLDSCAEKALELGDDSISIMDRYRQARQIRNSSRDRPETFLLASYDHFSDPYLRNWYMLTAGFQLPVGPFSLNPSVNGGYQGEATGVATDLQFNLDTYVNLGKRNHALVGYGFSPDGEIDYLPVHRAAAELWQVLPGGFGISAGIRYFYWNEHFPFLTFSAEKYAGNWWFSFRNYLFSKEYGISGSYYLSGRKYFASHYDHLTITLGYGTAPDEPVHVVSDLQRLNAASGRIDLSRKLGRSVRLILGAGYAYEEYLDQEFRNRISAKAGCFIILGR